MKVLSDDLLTFSQELQNLYDHLKNHTLPNGDLNSTNEYLKHIKKLGEKLKECQSLSDVLEECQSKIWVNLVAVLAFHHLMWAWRDMVKD